jgi:hypothetical protein
MRNADDFARHGQEIARILSASGIPARWVECRTNWPWAEVFDVIDAADERIAQAAADAIALALASADHAA